MSIHHTLRITLKSKKQRSVLKRFERIRYFISKGSFNEQSSVLGLPKIKTLKIKIKKEKSEEKAAAAQSGTPASPGSSTQAKSDKGAAKAASAK
jgi:small basic protein (TIGR04137 family)